MAPSSVTYLYIKQCFVCVYLRGATGGANLMWYVFPSPLESCELGELCELSKVQPRPPPQEYCEFAEFCETPWGFKFNVVCISQLLAPVIYTPYVSYFGVMAELGARLFRLPMWPK